MIVSRERSHKVARVRVGQHRQRGDRASSVEGVPLNGRTAHRRARPHAGRSQCRGGRGVCGVQCFGECSPAALPPAVLVECGGDGGGEGGLDVLPRVEVNRSWCTENGMVCAMAI